MLDVYCVEVSDLNDSDVVLLDHMVHDYSNLVVDHVNHEMRIHENSRQVQVHVVHLVDVEPPVLLVLLNYVPVRVDLPINVAIANVEVMEVSVGKDVRKPIRKQVRVALVVDLDVVRLPVVVVRVVISSSFHVKRTEQACIVHVHFVVGGVCKDASVLDFSISYHENEVGVNENVHYKMGMDLLVGSSREILKMVD